MRSYFDPLKKKVNLKTLKDRQVHFIMQMDKTEFKIQTDDQGGPFCEIPEDELHNIIQYLDMDVNVVPREGDSFVLRPV